MFLHFYLPSFLSISFFSLSLLTSTSFYPLSFPPLSPSRSSLLFFLTLLFLPFLLSPHRSALFFPPSLPLLPPLFSSSSPSLSFPPLSSSEGGSSSGLSVNVTAGVGEGELTVYYQRGRQGSKKEGMVYGHVSSSYIPVLSHQKYLAVGGSWRSQESAGERTIETLPLLVSKRLDDVAVKYTLCHHGCTDITQ